MCVPLLELNSLELLLELSTTVNYVLGRIAVKSRRWTVVASKPVVSSSFTGIQYVPSLESSMLNVKVTPGNPTERCDE